MKNKHLPIFGVGPVYVTIIILFTALGIYRSVTKDLPFIGIKELKYPFLGFGVFCIALGVYLWIKAVIVSKVDASIKNNKLLTTGIYAYVRNPVYSAFMLICIGIIIMHSNIVLMFLPIIYWLLMTILMKHTEEKWLLKLYGQEYIDYCKKVNRSISWVKRA